MFTPGKVEFRQGGNWDMIRGTPRDKILSPIGGLYESYGIWDDVVLRAHPAVYVKDLFIRPSVRRGELAVDFQVANDGTSDATVELITVVENEGKDVLGLPPLQLAAAPAR